MSVIIGNYKAGALLSSCVVLALAQSGETIIVDNVFSDYSTDAVASAWLHARIIKNNRNLGFAAACNVGVQGTTGEYLFFGSVELRVG